jgi:hypothetical protein
MVERPAAGGELSDGAQGIALAGGRSEQGAGCSHDLEPLEEALDGGGTSKQSSGEERHRAECNMERAGSGEVKPSAFASQRSQHEGKR